MRVDVMSNFWIGLCRFITCLGSLTVDFDDPYGLYFVLIVFPRLGINRRVVLTPPPKNGVMPSIS